MFGFGWPSSFGAASATPAPWTNTIAATAKAPVTRLNEISPKSGRWGSGMPGGISPASPTRATLAASASATTAVGTTSATGALTTRHGVHDITSKMASAPSPVISDATLILLG